MAGIPGVEIFSYKSAFVVFFNMQNLNFRGAPESGRTGFVLTRIASICDLYFYYHFQKGDAKCMSYLSKTISNKNYFVCTHSYGSWYG